jgi:hypothetical protein
MTSQNISQNLSSTQFLSQLIMSFLERQIAPQTILDVFLAQLRDDPFNPEEVSLTTCNALLEICSTMPSSSEKHQVLNFFAQHPHIKTGLSLKAALAGCQGLLTDPLVHNRQTLEAVENYVCSLLNHLRERPQELNLEQAQGLYHTIRQQHNESVLRQLPLLLQLTKELESYEGIQAPDDAVTPESHLSQILRLPEHHLAQRGLFHFGLTHEGAFLKWRLENIHVLVQALEQESCSDFRIAFLVEWFFDSGLKLALLDEKIKSLLVWALEEVFKQFPISLPVFKGVIRALQRDQAQIVAKSPAPDKDFERCLRVILPFYRHLIRHYSSKFIIQELGSWIQTLPYKTHQFQLIQYSTLLWIQVFANKEWNSSLIDCPKWVSLCAEHLLPVLVQVAPPYWLEKHLLDSFLRLQGIINHPEHQMEKKNIDFLVFVIRQVRQKTPYFSRAPEPLFALKALGACDYQERKLTELFESRFQLKIRHPALSASDQAFWEQLLARDAFSQVSSESPQVQTALHLMIKVTTDSRQQSLKRGNRSLPSK